MNPDYKFKIAQSRLNLDRFRWNNQTLTASLNELKSIILDLITLYEECYRYSRGKHINVVVGEFWTPTYGEILNLIDIELKKPYVEFETTYYIFQQVYKSEQILWYIYSWSEKYSLDLLPTLIDIKLAFTDTKYRYNNENI